MKVLIADDEPIARDILREHLADFAGIEVVGEAEDGISAVEQIARLKPDLVFLDLQMPELDGFSVARSLRGGGLPHVVFITAFDTHALEAFNIGAVDYLLKPVRRERLAMAIQRVEQQLRQTPAPAVVKPQDAKPPDVRPQETLRKIVGRLGTDFHMLDPASVIAFVADGETVHVLANQGRYFANHTLKALDERLPQPPFRRIHRKTIINTDHIRKVSPLSSKRWLLKMSNGLEVIVSKRMAGVIRDETNW